MISPLPSDEMNGGETFVFDDKQGDHSGRLEIAGEGEEVEMVPLTPQLQFAQDIRRSLTPDSSSRDRSGSLTRYPHAYGRLDEGQDGHDDPFIIGARFIGSGAKMSKIEEGDSWAPLQTRTRRAVSGDLASRSRQSSRSNSLEKIEIHPDGVSETVVEEGEGERERGVPPPSIGRRGRSVSPKVDRQ